MLFLNEPSDETRPAPSRRRNDGMKLFRKPVGWFQ